MNKVNTKVEARVSLSDLSGLSEAELVRARTMLEPRLLDGEILQVIASEERSQATNRERALLRLEAIVSSAARLPKHRKATKPTRSSIEKRLQAKRGRSGVKRLRSHQSKTEE